VGVRAEQHIFILNMSKAAGVGFSTCVSFLSVFSTFPFFNDRFYLQEFSLSLTVKKQTNPLYICLGVHVISVPTKKV
jgi:hypothetical protein